MNDHAQKIREHMTVVGSCGQSVGRVDRVEKMSIKLTKDSPEARGEHRFVPLEWVASVDDKVHLSKPCADVRMEWLGHPADVGDVMPEGV